MPSRPSRSEAPPPCSPEQSRAEKRTFPFGRKNLARVKLGKLQSAFFCEAVPLGGTAAGRSEAVSSAQNRFGFGCIIAPVVTCSELRIWSDFAEAKIAL
jgi:hypothetical protein